MLSLHQPRSQRPSTEDQVGFPSAMLGETVFESNLCGGNLRELDLVYFAGARCDSFLLCNFPFQFVRPKPSCGLAGIRPGIAPALVLLRPDDASCGFLLFEVQVHFSYTQLVYSLFEFGPELHLHLISFRSWMLLLISQLLDFFMSTLFIQKLLTTSLTSGKDIFSLISLQLC